MQPIDPFYIPNQNPLQSYGLPLQLAYSAAMYYGQQSGHISPYLHPLFVAPNQGLVAAQQQQALAAQQRLLFQQAAAAQSSSVAAMVQGGHMAFGGSHLSADAMDAVRGMSEATLGILGPLAMTSSYWQRQMDTLSLNRISPFNLAMGLSNIGARSFDPASGQLGFSDQTSAAALDFMVSALGSRPVDARGRGIGPIASRGFTGQQLSHLMAELEASGRLPPAGLAGQIATDPVVSAAMAAGAYSEEDLAGVGRLGYRGYLADAQGRDRSLSERNPLIGDVLALRELGITSDEAYAAYRDAHPDELQSGLDSARRGKIAELRRQGREQLDDIRRRETVTGAYSAADNARDRDSLLLEFAAANLQHLGFTNPALAEELSNALQANRAGDAEALDKTGFGRRNADNNLSMIAAAAGLGSGEELLEILNRTTVEELRGMQSGEDPFNTQLAKEAEFAVQKGYREGTAAQIEAESHAKLMAAAAEAHAAQLDAVKQIFEDSGLDDLTSNIAEMRVYAQSLLGGRTNQIDAFTGTEDIRRMRELSKIIGFDHIQLQQQAAIATNLAHAAGLDRDLSPLFTQSLLESNVAYNRLIGVDSDLQRVFGARTSEELQMARTAVGVAAAASREGMSLAAAMRIGDRRSVTVDTSTDSGRMFAAFQKAARGEELSAEERQLADAFMQQDEWSRTAIISQATGVSQASINLEIANEQANEEAFRRNSSLLELVGRAGRLEAQETYSQHAQEAASRILRAEGLNDTDNTLSRILRQTFDRNLTQMRSASFANDELRGGAFAHNAAKAIRAAAAEGDAAAQELLSRYTTPEALEAYLRDTERFMLDSTNQLAGVTAIDINRLASEESEFAVERAGRLATDRAKIQEALAGGDRLDTLAETLIAMGFSDPSQARGLSVAQIFSRAMGIDVEGEAGAKIAAAISTLETVERGPQTAETEAQAEAARQILRDQIELEQNRQKQEEEVLRQQNRGARHLNDGTYDSPAGESEQKQAKAETPITMNNVTMHFSDGVRIEGASGKSVPAPTRA